MGSILKKLITQKGIYFLVVCSLLAYIVLSQKENEASTLGLPIVALTDIIEHPVFESERKGLREGLDALGYRDGKNIKIVHQSAQGNISMATQIATQFANMKPKVVVAFSTPSAQAAMSVLKTYEVPLLFSTVTDYRASKLDTLKGVCDKLEASLQLESVKKVVKKLTRLGLLYNPGESNSVQSVKEIKDLCMEQDIEVIESTCSKTSDVGISMQNLVGKVDVVYVPNDNTVVSAMGNVSQIALTHKVPVVAGDDGSVQKGALLAYAYNRVDLGKKLAKMVVHILEGKKIQDLQIEEKHELTYYINKKTMESLGLVLDDEIVKKAVFY